MEEIVLPQDMDLTPDYAHMFRTMLRETRNQSEVHTMFVGHSGDLRATLLRDVQRWLAPLTIAANSATTVVAIEELRGVMTDMLSAIDQEARRLERGAEDEGPTSGEGLL